MVVDMDEQLAQPEQLKKLKKLKFFNFLSKNEKRILFIGRVFGAAAILGIVSFLWHMLWYNEHISIWLPVLFLIISWQCTWMIPIYIKGIKDDKFGIEIDIFFYNWIFLSVCWLLFLMSGGFSGGFSGGY